MGLLNTIKGLFATTRKESTPYYLETETTNNNNNSNSDTTMITKEEMMQIASMVASMLSGNNSTNVTTPMATPEPIVTEPTATELADSNADDKTEAEIDAIVDEAFANDTPTDQDSIMGGYDPLVSSLDSIVADIASKVEPKSNAEVKDCATIVEYSDKGVAIFGDTKDKHRLAIIKGYQTTTKSGRTAGAIFRRNLSSIEGQPCGWIISKENIEAKGGINVLKASLEATGMTVTIGQSVKDITAANHAEWEAKKKSETTAVAPTKTDNTPTKEEIAAVVPEAQTESKPKAKGKGKKKAEKPSIAPTPEQIASKKNETTATEPKPAAPIIPIVKPKEYKGKMHLTNSVKDWTFTERMGYTRIVNFTDPKGNDGIALLCSGTLDGGNGHFIVVGNEASKELLDILESDGLAMAIYKKLWTKGVRPNYISAYADGGLTDIAEWLKANAA